MKKIYLFLLGILVASFAAQAQQPSVFATMNEADEVQAKEPIYTIAQAKACGVKFDAEAPAKAPAKVIATLTTPGYGFTSDGLYVKFPLGTPTKRETLGTFEPYILAGDMVGNVEYVVDYTVESNVIRMQHLLTWDPKTCKLTTVCNLDPTNDPIVIDMAYCLANEKMYCLGVNHSTNAQALYTIDLTTGKFTKVSEEYSQKFYGLASDLAGTLYAQEKKGSLYILGRETGNPQKVGGTPLTTATCSYISSMAMDCNENMLYWAMCTSDGKTYNVQIDPKTGTQTSVGYIGTASTTTELLGFTIEKFAPESAAPAAITDLNMAAGSLGALTAKINWTNPKKDVAGNSLTSLSKVEVYLNGTLNQTLTDVTPGAAQSVILSNLATGYNRVGVIAYSNDSLKSERAEAMKWIGQDVPLAPTNITLSRVNPTTGGLTWTAPTKGVHGGYLKTSNIKYRITRKSVAGDSTIVEKVYRGTTYSDSTITELSKYHYVIQALSNDYGDEGESNQVTLGPALDVPYLCQWGSEAVSCIWDYLDCNGDGRTWSPYYYGYYMSHIPVANTDADDWAISPPLNLKADSTYYLYFNFYSGGNEFYPKHIQATIGNANTPEAQSTVVGDYSWAEKATQVARITVNVPKDGEYYFGLHDISKYSSLSIRLTNFLVITKHTGWITGKVTDENGNPVEGATVEIPNSDIHYVTAADGNYKLDYIPTGNYMVHAYKQNWADAYAADSVAVTNDQETVFNITMSPLAKYNIKAQVKDVNGQCIKNGWVTLSGYGDDLKATTDDNGEFAFNDVPEYNYVLKINKLKYEVLKDTFDLTSDTTFNITLQPKTLAPSDYNVAVSGSNVNLSWKMPRDIFRHDNGAFASQLGLLVGTRNTINGAVYPEPAVLKSISWVTTSYQGPHNEMNLWIFDIDSLNHPVSKVLFNVNKVATKGDEVWNTYELPEPVECPNGYLLGVSYDNGMSSLATDSGTDPDWPFIPYTNWNAQDYTNGSWRCMDASYVKRNHLIRATGDELGTNPQTFNYKYRVWRFIEDDFLDPEKWTVLASETSDLSLVDNTKGLADGEYVYAIAAVYPDNQLSEILYSDNVTVKSSGIEKANLASEFMVGPNPTSDVLHMNMTVDRVELYNVNGQLATVATGTNEVSVAGLGDGIYLLRATVGTRVVMKTIIVKK